MRDSRGEIYAAIECIRDNTYRKQAEEALQKSEEKFRFITERMNDVIWTVDLMVLDMIMDPGIDGLETYRRVLEINPKQKAIIVSGFSETERVKKAQEIGAGAYVRKPYILEMIGLAVKGELLKVNE